MEPEVFLRKVLALQASIRGFLVRRQFQSLRAEYEAIVREIEGDLGTLQWSEGWIPRPQFLPEKARFHYPWKGRERIPNSKQELWSLRSKESEKEATWEEKVVNSEESSAKLRSQGRLRSTSMSEVESTAMGPGLSQKQQKLQQLQHHRSHLAMELLWLQQAIHSRKEYLLLKQTLSSPEAGQTRAKPDKYLGQTYEKTSSKPGCLQENKSYGDRATGGPQEGHRRTTGGPQEGHRRTTGGPQEDHRRTTGGPQEGHRRTTGGPQEDHRRTTGGPEHADDPWQRGKSQAHKSFQRLATIDQTTAGAKSRETCYREPGPQLPTTSDVRAGVLDRFIKAPDDGGETFKRTCQQQLKLLEDQTPEGLKSGSLCSGKTKT